MNACDTIAPALIEATTSIVEKLKEAAQKTKAKAVDELKEEE